jgi:hypothetical protein
VPTRSALNSGILNAKLIDRWERMSIHRTCVCPLTSNSNRECVKTFADVEMRIKSEGFGDVVCSPNVSR